MFDTIKLPELLESEEKLRELWSNPMTRRDLMQKLETAGCYKDDLIKLQELISAENSDLFDVLEYVAFAAPLVSREARVETSRDNIYNLLTPVQREFIDYVLRNYVKVGVDELDISNFTTLISAKYGGNHEAERQLGSLLETRQAFIDFQQQLYMSA